MAIKPKSFDDITATVGKINSITDGSTTSLGELDSYLRNLHLGVYVNIDIGDNHCMCYARDSDTGRWGLCVRLRCGEDIENIPISRASREVRILAAKHVDEFLEAVRLTARKTLEGLEGLVK